MTTKPKTRKAPTVAEAIAHAKAAQVAYDAANPLSDAPVSHAVDNLSNDLFEAESDAYEELEKTPCANDEEFLEKLRYLTAREVYLFGSPFESRAEFVSVARAAALHFGERGK